MMSGCSQRFNLRRPEMRYTPERMHVSEGCPAFLPRPLPVPRDGRGATPLPPGAAQGDTFTRSSGERGRRASGSTSCPSAARDPLLTSTALPALQEGAQRDFWAWDFAVMPPAPKVVHATLRALGDRSQIWVDDSAYGQSVSAADVAALGDRLERHAPSGAVDPTRGIVDIDTAYFGPPPTGIDPDPRVTVLVTPFATFNGTSMDGYFNAFDQMPDSESWQKYQQHSNERNVIYLNAAGAPISGDYMQGVLAHELSHLLQYGRAPEQSSWLGETLAEVAMAVNGYHTDHSHVARHQRKPSSPVESETYVDYGAAYLLGTFMLERYGAGFITALAAHEGNGRGAIDATLRECGSTDTFQSLIGDWAVANYADARGAVGPGRHYASLDVPAPAETVVSSTEAHAEGSLRPTGVAYIRVDAERGARLDVEGGSAAVRALRFDGPRLSVTELDARGGVNVAAGTVLAIAAVGSEPARYTVQAAS